MPETVDKAVWLADLVRVRNVIQVMDQLYGKDTWIGGMLFYDWKGGFLLVACFDPDTYIALGTPFETLFPEEHLRPVTLEEACGLARRYRPWLAGDIPNTLRALKLLPRPRAAGNESVPPLAAVRAERDPPVGLP